MSNEQFDSTICDFLQRAPFQAFVVELSDGRQFVFQEPKLAVNIGGACFLTPDFELVDFTSQEVRDIRAVPVGAKT